MLDHGARQMGFAGVDLIAEMEANNVVALFDLGLDPVRIVAAVPEQFLGPNNELPNRRLIVATEYTRLATKWIASKGIDAELLHVSGSTEVFPPDGKEKFSCVFEMGECFNVYFCPRCRYDYR
jgi:ATP phosphoribosyltransferase